MLSTTRNACNGTLTAPGCAQSDTHVVLATLKRAPSELSSFARKVFKIDDHLGIAASGLASDGRVLCRYMRDECINHRRAVHTLCPASQLCSECVAVTEASIHQARHGMASHGFQDVLSCSTLTYFADPQKLARAGLFSSPPWRWGVLCARSQTRAR